MKWFFAKNRQITGSQNTDSGTCFVYDGIEKNGDNLGTLMPKSYVKLRWTAAKKSYILNQYLTPNLTPNEAARGGKN